MEPSKSHNEKAERSLLGAIFLDNSLVETVSDRVSRGDFYKEYHRIIWSASVNMFEHDKSIDVLTVSDHLIQKGKLESIGGEEYLNRLTSEVPSAANASHYADIVLKHSKLREVSSTLRERHHECKSVEDIYGFLEETKQAVENATEIHSRDEYSSMSDLLPSAVNHIEELVDGEDDVNGISTGLSDLDSKINGWQDGEFSVIAARPSMGKTSLALNMAAESALADGLNVGVFSLEMSEREIGVRLICAEAEVDLQQISNGQVSSEEWQNLVGASGELAKASIFVDDTPRLSISDLRSKARAMVKQEGLDILFVDYLQLIEPSNQNERRVLQISEMTKRLKGLAKDLGIPVICLSQLSRSVEDRQDKRPRMSDIRGSGAVEEDADVILMLYRDEYYNENSEAKGIAEIIINKNRNGPTGTVKARFDKGCTKFMDLAPSYR